MTGEPPEEPTARGREVGEDPPQPRPREVRNFAAELRYLRLVRIANGSQTALARRLNVDRSLISKWENGHLLPSRALVDRADELLNAGGTLVRAWKASNGRSSPPTPDRPTAEEMAAELVVERDEASLHYDNGRYTLTQRRLLKNQGADPVLRYFARIAVERFPGDPARSNRHHRHYPLTWDELGLRAWHGRSRLEPMSLEVKHDSDALKEVWLLFKNRASQFALYPGESTWIEYEYSVSEDKWGPWYQRAVRRPTERLTITLNFPAALKTRVWGTETSVYASGSVLRTAIKSWEEGDRKIFSWSTENPPVETRYRLSWSF